MSRDEILNLPAGIMIDRLIAEKFELSGNFFSRSIHSAMLVVEAMHDRGYWVEMFTQAGPNGTVEYGAEFIPMETTPDQEIYLEATATAFPLALCRAALLTVADERNINDAAPGRQDRYQST